MKRAIVVALVMACKRDTAVSVAPPASSAPAPSYAIVELHTDGRILFDKIPVRDNGDLTAHAHAATTKQPDFPATIRADSAVRYQRIIETMDALRDGGITDVNFGMPLD